MDLWSRIYRVFFLKIERLECGQNLDYYVGDKLLLENIFEFFSEPKLGFSEDVFNGMNALCTKK